MSNLPTSYSDARMLIDQQRPSQSVILNRPHAAERAARFFVEKFPGKSLYAVKANPSPCLLRCLWAAGIDHYDVASIAEVRLVASELPEAVLCFMHPVKTAEAIKEAYFDHGVRVFALDSLEELAKIQQATHFANDLTLCVRIRVPSEFAELSLAAKFGAIGDEITPLLQAARQASETLGLCFHIGSQAMTPHAFVQGLERVRAAIADASITIDIVDVGGGFPSIYPDLTPPPLEDYFAIIDRTFESLPISYSAELWCEPGRALCAEYNSLIVRIERRRGLELFINDGAYGALFDAAHIGWRFPVRSFGDDQNSLADFSFFGPTCDDIDYMAGPFQLPETMKAGDYIEIGMIGAYGAALRTSFNGFGESDSYDVEDEPMSSLYTGQVRTDWHSDNVISFSR